MSRFEDNRLFVLNDSHAPRLSPALAQEIGLNESILFLQLEFLIAVHGSLVSGRRWVRMSVRDLEREFPFWSYSTINRAVQSLEARGLIAVENFNRRNYDKTRWFSIDLAAAAGLKSIAVKPTGGGIPQPTADEPARETSFVKRGGVETRSTQNETGSVQDETGSTQIETAIHRELNPETKPESTHTPAPAPAPEAGMKQGEGVCVLSGYSYEQRLAYARNQLHIDNPEGFAMSKRAVSGEFDEAITAWLAELERPGGAKPERDVSGCPDCHGSGWWYPEGTAKGAARCRHAGLDAEGADARLETVPP
jgi:hypothetical protein